MRVRVRARVRASVRVRVRVGVAVKQECTHERRQRIAQSVISVHVSYVDQNKTSRA